jgi:hypothetical protein
VATVGRIPVRTLHKIHLWVGVIVGIQLLLWAASGLFMTAWPIEQIRGTTLRREVPPVALTTLGSVVPPDAVLTSGVERAELTQLLGRPVYKLTAGDRSWLVDARTGKDWTISRDDALAIALAEVTLTPPLSVTAVSDPPPLELRRPGGAWMIGDAAETHVYIGKAGEVMAIRTSLWRWYDMFWGLHILDPQSREDTHHPILIASAALALGSVISGIFLLWVRFRPRKRRA